MVKQSTQQQNPLLDLKWKMFSKSGELFAAFKTRQDCGTMIMAIDQTVQNVVVKHGRTEVWDTANANFTVNKENVDTFCDIIAARALGE